MAEELLGTEVIVTETGTKVEDSNTNPTDKVEKTYTEAELKQLLQSESDKRVNEALTTSKTKWLQEAQEAQAEAVRLAALSEEDKWKEELDKREQTVAEKELRIKQLELTEFANNRLSELKLPTNVTKFLISADEETTLANIKSFKEEFDKAINSRVDEKLQTHTPATSSSVSTLTKESFYELPYETRAKMFKENPDEVRPFI